MKLTVNEVYEAIGGIAAADDEALRHVVKGITWDSRKVEQDMVFLALPGERVDGNDYIVKAIMSGAGAIICTKPQNSSVMAIAGEFACPVITVEDGLAAINDLAAYWRSKLRALVIGITGSTGKTSTKDLMRSVMSQRFHVCATAGNHNNELGVPYTVLSADEDCEVLIVEMGMRGLGQIAELCDMVQPAIGVVSNVGVCHMELLGSRENIALAKSELISALPATGLAVINNDDDMSEKLLDFSEALMRSVRVRRFGTSEGSYTTVSNLSFDELARATFDLQLGSKEPFTVRLALPGEHNVSNALSVACVADYLGLSAEQIADGFAAVQGSGMRMEIVTAASGAKIINDAYNANPDSMKAALTTLAGMSATGRRIAILGDMGELGPQEADLHYAVGVHAASCNIDELICIGPLSAKTAEGACASGMDASVVKCFDTVDEALSCAGEFATEGDAVLVKASRFMGFERIVKEMSA